MANVYVDESKARGFYMAAAAVPSKRVREVRRTMRGLLLPRQDRLHMVTEKESRRHQILDVVCGLGIDVVIYTRESAGRKQVQQRMACIAGVVDDAVKLNHQRIVFERDDTLVKLDRQAIIEASRKHGVQLQYEHLRPSQDLLLGIPDAIVWAWAKGGLWQRQVANCSTVRVDG